GIEIADSRTLRDIVACDALANALSALDIVMTPTGLGVVATETIAPASRERSAALRRDFIRTRDKAVYTAVNQLMSTPVWRQTPAAGIYLRSLMPLPDLSLYGVYSDHESESMYEAWLAYTARLSTVEQSLAEETISYPVLCLLRDGGLSRELRNRIVPEFLKCAMDIMHDRQPSETVLTRLTETVRSSSETREIWRSSTTAGKFNLPTFENKKQSGGYFF
ncbi:MAG: hypothetical protein K2H86_09080, partial [Muribaculaceae bacterium]|nr:hypothetical protein [Muribaculaceae bacterium]